MAYEFKLPDIGEGVVEGEIVEWLVSEGEEVSEDQPLVAVMTDKATVEIPSPKAGKVVSLGAKAGDTVPVGSVLVTIDAEGGGSGDEDDSGSKEKDSGSKGDDESEKKDAESKKKGSGSKKEKDSEEEDESEKKDAGSKQKEAPSRPAPEPSPSTAAGPGQVLASPATRKRARELGVDLSSIEGTGPRGRITVQDVERASQRPAAAPAAGPAASKASEAPSEAREPLLAIPRREQGSSEQVEERVPLKGLRKRIAEAMVHSKHTAAHFAYVDECDVTELVALRKRLKPQAEKYGVKLTYLPFIMKALVPCLKEFPLLNSTLDDEAGELVLKKYYNIGVATDTPQGLVVPVVKDCDRKSVLEIAAEITELTGRARAQRTKMEDIQDGTFTVTSTGNIGGLFATPIINHPEVAILGVPKIQARPVVVDGAIAIRDMIHLAISLDHRVVDGAEGARFMNALIGYLSEPSRIFLELA